MEDMNYSEGDVLKQDEFRRLMSSPLVVDRTGLDNAFARTFVLVALAGGRRTTMVWKFQRGKKTLKLAHLQKEVFCFAKVHSARS
jgi:hypothetical protein